MTALGSGAPGRETMTDDTSRRGLGWQILALLVIGLIFRLMMAYGLDALRGSGFETDLRLFAFWAENLADQGPFGFYERDFFADYTPGYLYALWAVGIVGGWLGGIGDLIKLPAILTDVVLAYVVYRMVLDLGVTRRRALIGAAVVLVNPITWFDSVIWGQVDSFGTVFLLLSVRELWKGRHERAAILAVVAALVKPQLAILVPIVAFVTIRRVLWPEGRLGRRARARAVGLRLGAQHDRAAADLQHRRRRVRDRRRPRRAVRPVGGDALDDRAVPRLLAPAARVQHRRDVLVRHRQRVQPVGAVPAQRREHGHQRRLDHRRTRCRTRRRGRRSGRSPRRSSAASCSARSCSSSSRRSSPGGRTG